jgi:hypothetical protein
VELHRIVEIWQFDAFIEAAIFGMDDAEWPACPWIWRAEHDVVDIDAAMPWRGEIARTGCGREEKSAEKNRQGETEENDGNESRGPMHLIRVC